MRYVYLALLALICLTLARPGWSRQARDGFVPVNDAMLEHPDPADWLMWRRTQNGWGYSPLDQIDRGNVGGLSVVWSRPLAAEGIQEGTPLVHDGVMYMPNPNDVIQAVDAASGELIWEYRRRWPEDLTSFVRAAAINRNLAIYGNRIIDTSGDDYVFALDAETGELAWETRILDYASQTAQQSSGPIVADGKIISGRNCYSEGGPEACVITAHDAVTGRELWRRRTIPGPGEPGDETWGDVPFENRWHVGSWMVPSYDPELGLIYIGTSVTSPAPKYMLGSNAGQYLYHNSTLALDAETGEIVWYYQHLVDHWDLDHPFERLLVDTMVAPDPTEVDWINPNLDPGETRHVVTGIPGKTGVVYTLDRETGEFLWARPTVAQTVVESIDGTTGRVTVNSEMLFTAPGQERLVCPSSSGGKNWPAGAYSPLTRTMYFPLQNTCMRAISSERGPTFDFLDRPGARQLSRYGVRMEPQITPGAENVGTVIAISVETGETVWRVDQRAGVTSLLATAGGLVFGGDASGNFRAFDQETGEALFETNLGSAVTGFPISFAVDGRQYVAVSTGSSLVTNATSNLIGESPGTGYELFVFGLPAGTGRSRD